MKTLSNLILALILLFFVAEKWQIVKFRGASYERYASKVSLKIPFDLRIKRHMENPTIIFSSDNLWLGLHSLDRKIIPTHRFFSELSTLNPSLTIEGFVKEHGIQYIVADKEMISWPWFREALPVYFGQHCKLIGEVKDDFYNFSDYLSKRSPTPLVTRIYEITR